MARALLLLLLCAGCVTATDKRVSALEAQLAELRAARAEPSQLGGPEASAPVASLGTWVPAQAVRKSLLREIPPSPFGGGGGGPVSTSTGSFSDTLTLTKGTGIALAITGDPGSGATDASLKISGAGSGDNAILIPDAARIRGGASNWLEFGGTSLDVSQNFSAAGTVTASQGIRIASGTTIERSIAAASTIDFASTSDTTADSSNITVTGAAVGDGCVVGVPVAAQVTGATFECFVTATNTVVIRFNANGAAIDPASGSFTVRVLDP